MNESESLYRIIFFTVLSTFVVYISLLLLPGCTTTTEVRTEETIVIRPQRQISVRCAEIAPEISEMDYWCHSSSISPSQAREACRLTEQYRSECL